MSDTASKKQLRVIALVLLLLACAVYWRALGCGFTNFDDTAYVTGNPHVTTGLSAANLAWAFNVGYCSNWHPLTWISHMLDCTLFGTRPAGHHAVNLLLHLANTVLLFLVLNRLTKSQWKSAFVAALFAVHPLHVESVAWVAERKDVLSTLFWLLTMWTYVRYVEHPGAKRYFAIIAFFGLGLMAKPMLVTLPIVLLMLDYWPLGRLQTGDQRQRMGLGRLVWEKAPLFALSAGCAIVTYIAQKRGEALSTLDLAPFGMRIENALVSYAAYLVKMVWPSGLAPFYPFPMHGIPMWKIGGAAFVLCAISALVYRYRKHAPYLVFGWLWYVVTLLPVIGLVQVGSQAMADRYTYVPLIGLFIMVAWGVPESMGVWGCGSRSTFNVQRSTSRGRPSPPAPLPTTGEGGRPSTEHPTPNTPSARWLAVPAGLVVLACMACTWVQIGYWKDSIVLFTRTMNVTTDNYTAYANLASAYAEQKDYAHAEGYYARALEFRGEMPTLHFDYGNALYALGKLDEAALQFHETLRLDPDFKKAQENLGIIESKREYGNRARALLWKSAANPDDAVTHMNRAVALDSEGKSDEALREYHEAIRLNPNFAEAHSNLGVLLKNRGDLDAAIREYREAVRLKPQLVQAHINLAIAYYTKGSYEAAWNQVYECRSFGYSPDPGFLQALSQKMPDPGQ